MKDILEKIVSLGIKILIYRRDFKGFGVDFMYVKRFDGTVDTIGDKSAKGLDTVIDRVPILFSLNRDEDIIGDYSGFKISGNKYIGIDGKYIHIVSSDFLVIVSYVPYFPRDQRYSIIFVGDPETVFNRLIEVMMK